MDIGVFADVGEEEKGEDTRSIGFREQTDVARANRIQREAAGNRLGMRELVVGERLQLVRGPVSDVLTFVRNAFGNKAAPVTQQAVRKSREASKDQKSFYEAADFLK